MSGSIRDGESWSITPMARTSALGALAAEIKSGNTMPSSSVRLTIAVAPHIRKGMVKIERVSSLSRPFAIPVLCVASGAFGVSGTGLSQEERGY